VNALIIHNPRAGKHNGENGIAAAARILEAAGWSISVESSAAPGEATRIAQDAVQASLDAVLVAGGDGTINETVQALAGSETALGYIPVGTVNVWAREISLPLEAERAAHVLVEGTIQQIDLGIVDDRYFLLMAGIGFDAEVVRRAQSLEHHKRRFGVLPYVAAGLSTAPIYWGADVELRYDGIIRRVQALMIVVGNTRLYGGRFQLTPNAVANDGWLDLCIVKGRGPLALARQSLPLLLSGSVNHSDVELLRVREITIQADEPLPVQVDGELAGQTPVHFGIAPGALRAIVPRGLASDLIA
jgi:diacylglycerol kinase (ATP)